MRGRHTYAFLRMMELDELVAHDLDAYVDLAVKLAADGAWRERLRREIGSRLPRLYGDLACVRGLEEFLYGAVAGARRAAAP
jgi:predicted O-linked N-acetylglucosamine transferase (SPINDLY family)